jgi:hypothetical protein
LAFRKTFNLPYFGDKLKPKKGNTGTPVGEKTTTAWKLIDAEGDIRMFLQFERQKCTIIFQPSKQETNRALLLRL